MNTCIINPLVTEAQCGGMYQRALENHHNPEFRKCLLCGQGKNYLDDYEAEHTHLTKEGECERCHETKTLQGVITSKGTVHVCSWCRIKIREEDMNGPGVCECCGRHMSLQGFWGHQVCSTCRARLLRYKEDGKTFEEAQPIVADSVNQITGPGARKHAEPEKPITKQEQKETGAEYQENKAAFESLEKIPVPECLQKPIAFQSRPWADSRIPEFLLADEKLLSRAVRQADEEHRTVIGMIMTALDNYCDRVEGV